MIFGQRNYPEELGTGFGISIAQYGCALTCVASLLVNCFRKNTDPHQLNQALIGIPNHGGFAYNGEGDYDLIIWAAIHLLYGDVNLVFNNAYPTQPADMNLIDAQLAKGCSVVVGVSFVHNPNATQPTHYVEIYKKNSDGSYQCRDPWFADDTSFNKRYAVNGMSAANAILQAVSYNGPVTPLETPQQILQDIKAEMGNMDNDNIKVIKVKNILTANNV